MTELPPSKTNLYTMINICKDGTVTVKNTTFHEKTVYSSITYTWYIITPTLDQMKSSW